MDDLQDKVAIVTGGGSGIGRAIALLYAAEGAKIVVSDIDEKAGNKVVNEITKKDGTAIFIKANSADPKDAELLVKQTVKKVWRATHCV